MKTKFKARTPIELAGKIYKYHGWHRAYGESRWKRIEELYDLSVEDNIWIVAERKKDA